MCQGLLDRLIVLGCEDINLNMILEEQRNIFEIICERIADIG